VCVVAIRRNEQARQKKEKKSFEDVNKVYALKMDNLYTHNRLQEIYRQPTFNPQMKTVDCNGRWEQRKEIYNADDPLQPAKKVLPFSKTNPVRWSRRHGLPLFVLSIHTSPCITTVA
jgi:hypothetical protein